jgi:hypothetical protein
MISAEGSNYEEMSAALFVIEKQIFKEIDIQPSKIADSSIDPIIQTLKSCSISVDKRIRC